MAVANALAYYDTETVMGIESFKIQASSLMFASKAGAYQSGTSYTTPFQW